LTFSLNTIGESITLDTVQNLQKELEISKEVQTSMRADKFIKMHIQSTDRTMKMAPAAIATSNTSGANNNVININPKPYPEIKHVKKFEESTKKFF